MRFKLGSKVEVMNSREVPFSWRTGEILSGDRHTYTVRYDREAPTERVSKKLVRPFPPFTQGVENLLTGDIVEVFDNFSWKIASILKSISKEKYLVRVLGSSQEFCIHRSDIRVRKVWEDDKWTLLSKGCGGCGILKTNKLSRIRKRPTKCVQKMRVIEKNGQRERRKYINDETNGRIEVEEASRISENNGYESEGSSVGSCSVTGKTNIRNNIRNRVIMDSYSDAESSYGTMDKELEEEEEEEEICYYTFEEENVHTLELHAYCRTLKALYASGPLSWEQEALLTNLRIMLHISNDEHLMELKNLISAKNSNV